MAPLARPRIRHGDGSVVHLRVRLAGVTMSVWRRLEVSSRATLQELHAILQRSFGQLDAAAHQFRVDGVDYHAPEPGLASNHATDQTDLRALSLQRGDRFTHTAETSADPWQHDIVVENRTTRLIRQRLPWCTEGGGASPPEDCDGPLRYNELLAAFHAPLDASTAELREWLPAEFEPEFVDLTAINAELGRLPKQRLES
jgi:hypothetical protein